MGDDAVAVAVAVASTADLESCRPRALGVVMDDVKGAAVSSEDAGSSAEDNAVAVAIAVAGSSTAERAVCCGRGYKGAAAANGGDKHDATDEAAATAAVADALSESILASGRPSCVDEEQDATNDEDASGATDDGAVAVAAASRVDDPESCRSRGLGVVADDKGTAVSGGDGGGAAEDGTVAVAIAVAVSSTAEDASSRA